MENQNKKLTADKDAIKAFQEVCKHTYPDGSDAMPNTWHDGHHDYYVCEICGKQVKV